MDIRGETIQNGEPSPEYPVEIENKTNILLAIEILKKLKSKVTLVEADEKEYRLPFLMDIEKQAIETVLEELEKKDNIINEMAEYIIDLIKYNNSEEERDKEEIKEYFTKKSEKGE